MTAREVSAGPPAAVDGRGRLKVCANLSTLFTDRPLLERPEAARAAGFAGVEILFPYDVNAADLGRALDRAGLPLVLMNCPPPNYANAEASRGFAAVPDAAERFRHDFRRARRYARALGAERLHLMAGVAEGSAARSTFVGNLRWAAAEDPGLRLTIEPINTVDVPGYFLCDPAEAVAILGEVGAPNLSLQFDAYHVHRITGDVLGAWHRQHPHVGHAQISDHPGRHEPGRGEIDFHAFFGAVRTTGYTGWIGAEYHPEVGTEAGLGWLEMLR